MAEATIEVRNPSGFHARPAAVFVKAAAGFTAEMSVTNLTRDPDRPANAKSILAVLGIGAELGHLVRISADGFDADDAVRTLVALVASGLGEAIAEAGR
jgi:phosphotransferase system HPr (HPr) family protein